jgi:hypothetical protein
MEILPQSQVESGAGEAKEVWQTPEIVAVTSVMESEGLGGGGPDFGSELS